MTTMTTTMTMTMTMINVMIKVNVHFDGYTGISNKLVYDDELQGLNIRLGFLTPIADGG